MATQGGGTIVNIASVSAFAVMDRYRLASYTASKRASTRSRGSLRTNGAHAAYG
jgi:short-subunit dehydrogenase